MKSHLRSYSCLIMFSAMHYRLALAELKPAVQSILTNSFEEGHESQSSSGRRAEVLSNSF